MTDAVKENEELGPEEEVLEDSAGVGGPGDGADGSEGATSDPESAGEEAHTVGLAGAEDGGDAPVDGPEPAEAEGGEELVELRDEFETLNDRHLRLAAEFNNFRRRSEQERLGAWSRAQADLVGKFLDVLDDLHRTAELDLSNATVKAIMEGIDLVERKFVRVLEEADVEMIDPEGQPFDPELMEAMMRVPAEADGQADTVAQVFQKGYALKGILIRPARVSVYTEG